MKLSPVAMPLALLASIAVCGSGCSEAVLYDPVEIPSEPNKVAFTGQVCTDNPAERSFPLRVVFVVDASPIMPLAPTDAAGIATLTQQRVNAIRDVVSVLRAPDSAFALVRYGGEAFVTPDGTFTSNAQEIIEAAGALSTLTPCAQTDPNVPVPTSDGCRRLGGALSLATSLVGGDLLSTAKGPRSRTKYVIIVVQAGPTDDNVLLPTPECDVACVLGSRVAELREFVLENGGADFQLHAVDLSPLSPDPAVFGPTKEELQRMAFAGSGEYRPICNRDDLGNIVSGNCAPQAFNLLGVDINSARNTFLQKSFVVSNLNAIATNDGAIPDSDMDGFADVEEAVYGTDPTLRDSDGDGIGDRIEVLLSTVGVDPLLFDDPQPCDPIDPLVRITLDTDGDSLTDCEEALLRLDATLFDTDADGIPDQLEVLAGTNFLDNDGLTDSDFDGTPNIVELRAHTDPRSADAKARNELGYLYRETDLGIRELFFATQPRDITGVTIEDVSGKSSLGNGEITYILTGASTGALSWRDANESEFGPAVTIAEDGTYQLNAASCLDLPEGEDCEVFITVSVLTAILPPFPVDELVRVAAAERQCTDFRIRNVTLVETLAADGRPRGFNDVRIFFGQVPAAVPESFGIFRVAQFPFNYVDTPVPRKDPDVADQLVNDFNFVLFE